MKLDLGGGRETAKGEFYENELFKGQKNLTPRKIQLLDYYSEEDIMNSRGV